MFFCPLKCISACSFKEIFTDDVCASGGDWFLEDKGKESSSMEVPLLVFHIQPPPLFWLVISCFSPCSRESVWSEGMRVASDHGRWCLHT